MKNQKVTSLGQLIFELIIIIFFFSFLFYPDKFQIAFTSLSEKRVFDSIYIRVLKVAFWLFLVNLTIRFFIYFFIKNKKNETLTNIGLSSLSVIIIFIFLEIILMFVPVTHEGSLTMASKIWLEKYWGNTNSMGYRDPEPVFEENKKTILFLGDSYTAGSGLKDINERFSNIVSSNLDSVEYESFNLGLPGVDTKIEADRLKDFPVKPDIVVLNYCVNDIEIAAQNNHIELLANPLMHEVPQFLKGFITRFYLPNFIYWLIPKVALEDFDHYLTRAYTHSDTLEEHINDLSEITEFCNENDSKLIVVMIPFIYQLDFTQKFTTPVTRFLESEGAEVINIEQDIAKIPEKERIAGRLDSHGSFLVHKAIAKRIMEKIK